MHRRKLVAAGAAVLSLAAAGSASAAQNDDSVTVCNEAENSHRGGYTVSGGPVDPVPPAFLRGSQMKVGANENAAYHSPALRTCSPVVPPGGGGDDGGGGGDV
jgi:hypothetical protein